MTSAALPLSGAQHRIRSGAYEAVIASTGASLRELRHDGRDLIVPFGADEVRPDYRGATLAPWPNRIVDGTYAFDGEDIVTALTEPERSHALHGLVSWADFEQVTGVPIHMVSTSPDRDHTIMMRHPYLAD